MDGWMNEGMSHPFINRFTAYLAAWSTSAGSSLRNDQSSDLFYRSSVTLQHSTGVLCSGFPSHPPSSWILFMVLTLQMEIGKPASGPVSRIRPYFFFFFAHCVHNNSNTSSSWPLTIAKAAVTDCTGALPPISTVTIRTRRKRRKLKIIRRVRACFVVERRSCWPTGSILLAKKWDTKKAAAPLLRAESCIAAPLKDSSEKISNLLCQRTAAIVRFYVQVYIDYQTLAEIELLEFMMWNHEIFDDEAAVISITGRFTLNQI